MAEETGGRLWGIFLVLFIGAKERVIPHPLPGQGLYQLGPRLGKGSLKAPSSCRRDFLGRGHRDPIAALSQLFSQLFSFSGSSPPARRGLPILVAPQSMGYTVSAGRQEPGKAVLHAAPRAERPPRAETHKCPQGTKQTIIRLATPGTIGITNATHSNCLPPVPKRLFVGPAGTAQHGRTGSVRRRPASA